MIHVFLEPEREWVTVHKGKSARAVLNRLGLDEGQALIIDEEDNLLTPDRLISIGACLRVRKVRSRG